MSVKCPPSFVCEHCGASFLQSTNLQNHLRTHSGDRPFQCEQCSYTAKTQGTLQNHLNSVHFNHYRPCDICGSVFSDHSSLRHHRLLHLADAQFKCPVCSASFRQRPSFRRHIKSMHGGTAISKEDWAKVLPQQPPPAFSPENPPRHIVKRHVRRPQERNSSPRDFNDVGMPSELVDQGVVEYLDQEVAHMIDRFGGWDSMLPDLIAAAAQQDTRSRTSKLILVAPKQSPCISSADVATTGSPSSSRVASGASAIIPRR